MVRHIKNYQLQVLLSGSSQYSSAKICTNLIISSKTTVVG